MSHGRDNTGDSELPGSDNLLQTSFWARFKSEFGWAPSVIRASGTWSGDTILVLQRRVAPATWFAYVPYAPRYPSVDICADAEARTAALADLGTSVGEALAGRPVCVRFDLDWPRGSLAAPEFSAPVRKASADVQPASTVMVDLARSESDLLAGMHKKHRYNIGLAHRKGVTVRHAEPAELATWYDIYRETARRDRITIHSLRYYTRLFEIAGETAGIGTRLYVAEHDGETLAGIIVVTSGRRATYLYGASSDRKRNLMPNYALQWAAILDSRKAGMASYDLFGIPPDGDADHPMAGLYRFKTGFGGGVLHREGCWDVVTRPVAYRGYRVAERTRAFYFHRVRKARAR